MKLSYGQMAILDEYWYVRNYNTSSTSIGQKSIKMIMNKSWNLTYSIDDAENFKKLK